VREDAAGAEAVHVGGDQDEDCAGAVWGGIKGGGVWRKRVSEGVGSEDLERHDKMTRGVDMLLLSPAILPSERKRTLLPTGWRCLRWGRGEGCVGGGDG